MQSPPFPRYLVPPRFKYYPQHHVLKDPQLPFLPQCQLPSFTPIQNNRKIITNNNNNNNKFLLHLLASSTQASQNKKSIRFPSRVPKHSLNHPRVNSDFFFSLEFWLDHPGIQSTEVLTTQKLLCTLKPTCQTEELQFCDRNNALLNRYKSESETQAKVKLFSP